ncbi:MAG: hypothetical protein AB7G39_06195 [Alphaproteobacteria bacterium]
MPIPSREETLTGLFAAWRVLLRDGRAVALFDATPAGFWKSFFCAVVVLPPYVFLMWLVDAWGDDPAWGRVILVEAIAYVIAWTAWPVLIAHIVPLLDRQDRYIRYIVAYNWSSGPQTLVWVAATLLSIAGLLPTPLGVVVLVVLLAYQTFIARVALEIATLPAVALALSDFFLGHIVRAARELLLQ